MADKARFTMIDEPFECEVCSEQVTPLGYTARDHCPFCLCSKHVDENPGDRSCECQGILRPTAIEPAKKGGYKIVYVCDACGEIKRNVAAADDNMNLIIRIMSEQRYPATISKRSVGKRRYENAEF